MRHVSEAPAARLSASMTAPVSVMSMTPMLGASCAERRLTKGFAAADVPRRPWVRPYRPNAIATSSRQAASPRRPKHSGANRCQTAAAGLISLAAAAACVTAVSYTHLRAHETVLDLVCRLLLEKK